MHVHMEVDASNLLPEATFSLDEPTLCGSISHKNPASCNQVEDLNLRFPISFWDAPFSAPSELLLFIFFSHGPLSFCPLGL